MRINLCNIIDSPGALLPFSCELEADRLAVPAISEFVSPPRAEGNISNSAGILSLRGVITAELLCICDRCGDVFPKSLELPLEVTLAADPEDADDPDLFPLDGDWLDLSDLLETCFILNTDAKFLCREDCAGLCSRCGKNLNDGPCGCGKEIDPRLAVLQQLLDKKDE